MKSVKKYLFEMHCHENIVSRCSTLSPLEIATMYKKCGFYGIFVTDHWLNGNTSVRRDLSWEQRIYNFCAGYELTKIEGDKIGLEVYFAFEYSYHGTDFLIYNIGKDWLLKNKNCDTLSTKDFMSKVKSSDGFIVQAHPFRKAPHIDHIRLFPDCVDGIEIINSANDDLSNSLAKSYAEKYNFTQIVGSDTHSKHLDSFMATELTQKPNSSNEVISQIINRNVNFIKVQNIYS